MKKSTSYFTDEVTKDLMLMCKNRLDFIHESLEKEELSTEQKSSFTDECLSICEIMSFADSSHKDYLLEEMIRKIKAQLKSMWQIFLYKKLE